MSFVFLLFAIVFLTAGQLAQKIAADQVFKDELSLRAFARLARCREFRWGVVCLGLGTVLWLITLSAMDVGTAYPMLSLSFVLTVLSARLVLDEPVSPGRWLGAGLIALGTALMAAG